MAEDTLIVRPDAEVEVRRVPPGGAVFVAALAGGATLGEAAAAAMADDARFDLAGNISGLIAAGAIIGNRQVRTRGNDVTMTMTATPPSMAAPMSRVPAAWQTAWLWFQSVACPGAALRARRAVLPLGPHQVGRLPVAVAEDQPFCSRTSSSCTSSATPIPSPIRT